MEKVKGFVIILLCNLAGNLMISLTGLPLPGSVLGLLFLLAFLLTKVVKLDTVEPAAGLLITLMMLFILPGSVNMLNSFSKFSGVLPQALLAAVLTTLLGMLSAGLAAEWVIRLRARKKKEGEAP